MNQEIKDVIWERLEVHLTPTQLRRVAMTFGLGGYLQMTQRAIAKAEGVSARWAIQKSVDAALTKLRRDKWLFLVWLNADMLRRDTEGCPDDLNRREEDGV